MREFSSFSLDCLSFVRLVPCSCIATANAKRICQYGYLKLIAFIHTVFSSSSFFPYIAKGNECFSIEWH